MRRPAPALRQDGDEERGAAGAGGPLDPDPDPDPDPDLPPYTPSPSTFPAAAALFAAHPTPRLVSTLLLAGGLARAGLVGGGACPLGPLDAAAAVAGAAGWVAAEPGLHALLHAGAWAGSRIHADHHATPYHHVSIDPPALVLAWMGAVGLAAAAAVRAGAAPPGPALIGLLSYCAAGLCYEAVHFAAHCAYTPATAWGRALKAHHARHHLASEAHWLSFQAPWLDAWAGRAGGGGVGREGGGVGRGPMAVRAGEVTRAAARRARAGREGEV